MLFVGRMCQCGIHSVLWSHIGIHIRFFAAEPRNTRSFRTFFNWGPLFLSQYLLGTILLTPYSMVWDWRVSIAVPMLIYWPKLLYPCVYSANFPFLFFPSIDWYCGAGVFLLIECRSFSLCFAQDGSIYKIKRCQWCHNNIVSKTSRMEVTTSALAVNLEIIVA